MRLGLVLFGHLRSYKETYDSFKKLKSVLASECEVDVFCHTWDVKESLSPAWWKTDEKNRQPPGLVNEMELVSMYAPAQYEIETSKQFDEPELGIKSAVPLAGMCSMLYSQIKSFELLKQYEQDTKRQYDVVIKTRYDILYELSEEFVTQLQLSVQSDCVYLPSSNPYELAGAFSDVFAMGSRRQIEAYFSFNNSIGEAAHICKENGYRQIIPELIMSVYLKHKKVHVLEAAGIRINILRANGEKFAVNSERNFPDNTPLCFYKPSIEKCISFLPEKSMIIPANSEIVTTKYLGWILVGKDRDAMDDYVFFIRGNWISLNKIIRLINVAKQQKTLAHHVMRDFFEIAFWNAKYNLFKKILLAAILAAKGGYGLLYFNVIKKQKFR